MSTKQKLKIRSNHKEHFCNLLFFLLRSKLFPAGFIDQKKSNFKGNTVYMKNRYHEKCDFKLINKFHFPKPTDD